MVTKKEEFIEIPLSLAKLLVSKPEDFKDEHKDKYEETVQVSKQLLRLLIENR